MSSCQLLFTDDVLSQQTATDLVSFSDLQSAGAWAAECLFTEGAGWWFHSVQGSKPVPHPVPAANHSFRLTSNTGCYFLALTPTPKRQTHNGPLLLLTLVFWGGGWDHATVHNTDSFSFSTHCFKSRSAVEKSAEWAHEFMENGTVSTI